MARTSKQPGRTRLLNFFELAANARLVDLPGYGYAEGAREERDLWGALIDALLTRHSLRGVLVVVDARRGLLAGDRQLLTWAQQRQFDVHVLLSKADQLSRSAGMQCLRRVEQELAGAVSAQLFSAHSGAGVEQARLRLAHWLQPGSAA